MVVLRRLAAVVGVLVVATAPTTAYAYLDPGTGSFILQMLVAGFLGAILYVKLAWARTRLFFSCLFSSSSEEDVDPEPESVEGDSRR